MQDRKGKAAGGLVRMERQREDSGKVAKCQSVKVKAGTKAQSFRVSEWQMSNDK